jgi:D-arabinose 1-dehydrogenase-like Zn-dependent alcohol dehydrogenase
LTLLENAMMRPPSGTCRAAYAEYVLARAEDAYAVPESIPDAEAVPLFCPGITAYGAIVKAHLAPGKKVVLFGMGGVGHLVLQFARLSGAEVIVVSRSGRYLRLAEEIGGFALHYERGTENFRNIDRYGGTGLPVIRESGDCSRQRQKHHYRGTIKKTGVFPVNHIVVAKKQILENNPWRRLSSTKRSADRSSWHSSSRVQSGPATFSSSSCLCILRSHYWSL